MQNRRIQQTGLPCFVCGLEVPRVDMIDVTGQMGGTAGADSALARDRALSRTLQESLRMHRHCATHLAAQILIALHAAALAPDPERAFLCVPTERRGIGMLSTRELDVLRGIVAGETNAEIARRLGLKDVTVRHMVSRVLLKLDVESRTAAAVLATHAGLAP